MMIIVMGVSGSGKSTVGCALAERLGLPFYDADDFHPEENVVKMSQGIPLDDGDRLPWLTSLSALIDSWTVQGGAILACSALKESYRKILAPRGKEVQWVYLSGSKEVLTNRLQNRPGHFMPASLLDSQFEILEIPDYALKIDITVELTTIVKTINDTINAIINETIMESNKE